MPPSNIKGLWIFSASQVQEVELRGKFKKKIVISTCGYRLFPDSFVFQWQKRDLRATWVLGESGNLCLLWRQEGCLRFLPTPRRVYKHGWQTPESSSPAGGAVRAGSVSPWVPGPRGTTAAALEKRPWCGADIPSVDASGGVLISSLHLWTPALQFSLGVCSCGFPHLLLLSKLS